MTGDGTNRRRVPWLGISIFVVAVVAAVLLGRHFAPTVFSNRDTGGRRIGLLTEHAAPSDAPSFSEVARALSERYELSRVEPGVPGALDSLDVLVVLGSGHAPDAQLYEIDQFIMRGGRVAFLLDGADVSADRMTATAVRGNLFAYAGAYGATVNPDLVVDVVDGSMAHPDADVTRPYAFWPVGYAEPAERGGVSLPTDGRLVFAWASSVSLSGALRDDATASVVARSSGSSWTMLPFANLDPAVTPQRIPQSDRVAVDRGRSALAVAIDGVLVSAFAGMPVIVEDESGQIEFTEPDDRLTLSEPTRIFVVGSSRMFDDFVLEHAPANRELLLAAIDWLAH